MQTDPRQQGEHALKQANRAAKRGDLVAAERWTKTAHQMAAVHAQLAAAPKINDSAEDEEELCAELRRRIKRYVDCSIDMEAWEAERDAYIEALNLAESTGAPPPAPLRTHPAGPGADSEQHLIGLLQDPEPND